MEKNHNRRKIKQKILGGQEKNIETMKRYFAKAKIAENSEKRRMRELRRVWEEKQTKKKKKERTVSCKGRQ